MGGGPQTVDDAFSSPIERLHSRRALRAASTLIDACRQVRDPASGGLYYWNTTTDETTAVGAPRPTGPTALAVEDSRGLMRADAPSTTSLSRGLAVTEGMIRSLATEQARMCELSPRRRCIRSHHPPTLPNHSPNTPPQPSALGLQPGLARDKTVCPYEPARPRREAKTRVSGPFVSTGAGCIAAHYSEHGSAPRLYRETHDGET